MAKYSKQELIEEIQRVSEEHCGGDTPRVKDMKKYSDISYATYSNRFGCWSKAQKYCGFEPNKNSFSKKELVNELKRLSKEHCNGERPTTGDLKEHGKFSRPTYTNNFKSFWTALRKAGFDVEGEHGNLAQYSVSNEEIKREIKRLSTIEDGEIARFPTKFEFGEKSKFSNSLFDHRFGSYSKCLIELFDCELPRRRGFEISDDVFEEILQKVKEFAKNKCKYSAPTAKEYKEE